MKPIDKLYGVEEFHRGKWIPLLVKNKNPKEADKQRVTRTSEDYVDILNGDSKETKIRYVEIEEKSKELDSDLNPMQIAKNIKAKIIQMDNIDDIDKATKDVTYKSVLDAADKRKKELIKNS